MDVEEDQFQQYALKVIEEAKARGGRLYPLLQVAKQGIGKTGILLSHVCWL